jgi:SAM-dependent methyltransferase
MLDWGEGTYENTAPTLVPATDAAMAKLALTPGERVLDLGCGTGNAAIAAARRGAKVLAIDPAGRLVEVTAARAKAEGLTLEARVGDAGDIGEPDRSFDAVVSIFAVIFSPDADRSADEMVRVTRPGGRIVMTSWLPYGPIAEAGKILRAAMIELAPPAAPDAPPPKPPPWGDEAAVRALFESRGAQVTIDKETLHFESTSADGWFTEQESNHPVWRFVKRALESKPSAWNDLRARSIAVLEAGNLAKNAYRAASDYLVVKASVA